MVKKKNTPVKAVPLPINPILATGRGFNTLFARAATTGIFLAVVGLFGAVFNVYSPMDDKGTDGRWNQTIEQVKNASADQVLLIVLLIIVVAAIAFVFTAMIHGIQSYTSLQLAKGKRAGLNEAINAVMAHFGSYIVFFFWMNIKIALWSLLFVVPGIIAYYRYSFAGQLFFESDTYRHERALKESSRLTRKGLMNLFASQFLFNLITLFYMERLVAVSSNSEFYRIYSELDAKGENKPGIHWLSWLTLALPFILLLLLVLLVVLIGVVFALTKAHS